MRKVYLRPIMSPNRPNTSAPNGRTRNVDPGKELFADHRSQGAVEKKVIPLENRPEG